MNKSVRGEGLVWLEGKRGVGRGAWSRMALILVMFSIGISGTFAQAVGDYRSKAANMNWTTASSWETWDGAFWVTATTYPGQDPGTGTVTIQNGNTVTIDVTPVNPISSLIVGSSGILQYEATTARTLTVNGSVTINPGGIFRSALTGNVTDHQLIVGGSIVNNGTINFSTNANASGAGITFTGASNATFDLSGSTLTNLRQTNGVLLNKGTSASSVLSFIPGGTFQVLSGNTVGFLTITSGTFNLIGSNAFSNPVFYSTGGSYIIPVAGGFWLGNPNAIIVGMDGTVSNLGELRITDGTYNIGISSGNSSVTNSTGRFILSGGTMNIAGRFKISGGDGTITGGTMNIATVGHADAIEGAFHISQSADLTMSGTPLITFTYPNSNTVPFNDIEIVGGTGVKTISGGTFQMGTASTPSNRTFLVNSDIPLYNLTVYNTNTKVSLTDQLTVNNQLTLNGQLLLNDQNLIMGASAPAIAGTLGAANGMIVCNNGATGGEVRKIYSGNGSYTFPIGENTGVTEYSPLTLNFTTGAYAGGAYSAAKVVDAKHPDNKNITDYLTRYWNINTSGITGTTYNVDATYLPGDVIGTVADIAVGISTPLEWVKYGAINSATRVLSASGLTQTGNNIGFSGVMLADPTCSISGEVSPCRGTNYPYTATTNGTNPTYLWSIINNTSGATIVGSSTSSSVTINPGNSPGSYQVEVTVSANEGTSICSSDLAAVNPNTIPSVSIAASTGNNICEGAIVSFTATPVNEGSSPLFQWRVNGTVVGTNSPIPTFSYTPVNNDAVSCELTSNATCVTDNPATSNTVTMTVNQDLPVSVSITASFNPVCAGTSVIFTASPTNGGVAPTYQWKVNGSNVGSNSSTYTNATLASGDLVTCVLTSNETCATGNPATSNTVTMTVNSLLPASVSIAAVPSGAICAGTSVTFTATPVNGGTPTYQWKKGGVAIPSETNATYTSTSLVNGDQITVEMTSTATCATGSPATSNMVTMTVNSLLPASVSIAAVPSGAICTGTSVTFTATSTNGGAAPVYQWKLNGTNVGSNSTTYTNASLVNGDLVTCVLTSNATCASGSPATSNGITTTVNPLPTAVAGGTQTICVNATATIGGASSTNGTILWTHNGLGLITAGATTPTPTYTAAAGDAGHAVVLTMTVTGIGACNTATATATYTINVNSVPTATMSGTTAVCQNATSPVITFTGTNGTAPYTFTYVINGGSNLTITTISGNSVTVPAPTGIAGTFIYTLVSVHDASTPNCSQAQTGTAIITVYPPPVATAGGSTSICSNGSVLVSGASSSNGTRLWTHNGLGTLTNPTSLTPTYTAAVGDAGHAVILTMTVTSTFGCTPAATAIYTVNVYSLPTLTSPLTATVCSASLFNYIPASTVSGTTYSWTRAAVAGITPATASGTGAVNETLVNSTGSNKIVTYDYILTANGCTNTQNVTVTVSPPPALSSSLTPPAVCSNTPFPYLAVPTIAGTTLTWNRAAVAGISNPASSGSGNIGETLINTTNTDVVVTYVYTLVLGTCTNTQNVTVSIKPTPTVTLPGNLEFCKGDNVASIVFSSPVGGTTYTWTNNNTAIGLAASGSGNLPVFTATNTTLLPLTAIISVRPSANGCLGTVSTFNIVVYPTTNGGVINSSASVCTGANGGTLTLNGRIGSILEWQSSTDGGSTWVSINNTTTTQTYSNLVTTTQYRVRIQSGPCSVAYSTIAIITVSSTAVGGTVSADATVCEGTNSGTLTLNGFTGTVQKWQSSTNGGTTWSDIANATASQAYSNLINTTLYRAVVQSGTCPVANSIPATITVNPVSVGGNVAGSTTVCAGTNSTTLTLSGYTGSIVRWESSTDNWVTAIPIVNTSTTQIASNLTLTTRYRAVVQSGVCASVNSAVATVTVDPASVGGTVTGGTAICSGSPGGTLTLSGQVGNVIRWESSVDSGGTWSSIANNSTTYTPGILTQTTLFRAVVQSGGCSTANAQFTTVTVDPATVAGSVSGVGEICSGLTSGVLTLTGHTGTIIKWQSSVSPFTNWTDITNTSTTYTSGPLTQTTQFRAMVQSGNCAAVPSSFTTIVVSPLTVPGTVSGGTTICSGSPSGLLTLTGQTGSVIMWQSSTDLSTWNSIANTSTTYTSGSLTQTTYFRAVVKSGSCGVGTSGQTRVLVNQPAVGGSIAPLSTTKCSGTNTTVLTLSGFSLNVVKWQSSIDNWVTVVDIANTTNTLTATNLTTTTKYRAVISRGAVCPTVNSGEATITVNQNPILVITNPAEVCTPPVDLTAAYITSGSTPGLALTYWTDPAATIPYSTPSAANSGTYYIKGSLSGCYDIKPVTVTIHATLGPPIFDLGTNSSVCNGSTQVTYHATAANSLTLTYDIDVASKAGGNSINTATGQVTFAPAYIGTIQVSATATGCGFPLTAIHTITILVSPSVSLVASPLTLCAGSSATITATISGGTGYTSVISGDPNIGPVVYGSNNTIATWTVTPLGAGPHVYTVTTTGANGCSRVSNSVTINVNSATVPTITADYCVVRPKVRLTATAGYASYTWSNGLHTQSIDVDIASNYWVQVTDAGGCVSTSTIDVVKEKVIDGSFTNFNAGAPSFFTEYNQQQSYYNGGGGSGLYPEGYYAVNTNAWSAYPALPQGYHPSFHGRDHTNNTTGSRNFMMVNGSTTLIGSPARQRIIWQQTVTVTPNTDYYFSAWAMNLNPGSPARLQFEVNGVLVGTVADLSSAPKPGSEAEVNLSNWVRFYSNPLWPSGASTTATIRIRNLNTTGGGNDFGLDDISFGSLSSIPFTVLVGSIPPSLSVCNGSAINLTADVSAGAFPPIVYTWTGPNGFTSSLQNPVILNATSAKAGVYTVSIVDGYGCSPITGSTTVTVNPSPVIPNQPTIITCSGIAFTVTPVNGGTTIVPPGTIYTWTAPTGTGFTPISAQPIGQISISQTLTNQTSSPVTATYTVTPKTGNCTGAAFTVTVTLNPPATAYAGPTQAVCASSPSVTLAGSVGGAATSGTWGGGTGTYNPDNTKLNAIYTPSAAEVAAGTVTLTLTTNNPGGSCGAASSNVTITIRPVPVLSTTKTDVKCYGGSSGAINLTVTGTATPYTYLWTQSGGGVVPVVQTNLEDLSGLVPGTYTVKVTGTAPNTCTASTSVTITQPTAALQASETHTGLLCTGSNIGAIDLTVTGGTIPYSYVWTASSGGVVPTGQVNGQDLIGLVAGTYSVTVTDANLCTILVSATIGVAANSNPIITTCPPAYTIDGCGVSAIMGLVYSATPVNITDVNFTAAGGVATDNCAVTTYSYTDSQTGTCPITVTRTFTVGDAGGLKATCQQRITIRDITSPIWTTAVGSLDRTLDCSNLTGWATAQGLVPVASDLCDTDVSNVVKVSGGFVSSGGCTLAGSYTNTWTVTDNCGNVSPVFRQIITIVDTTAPTWTTSSGVLDRSVACDDPIALDEAQSMAPEAFDLCNVGTLGLIKTSGSFVAGSCGKSGTYTNTWVATDACGNHSETYIQIITVEDKTAPNWVTLPGDLDQFISCNDDGALAAAQLLSPVATDNCDDTVIYQPKVPGSYVPSGALCPQSGTYTNTWIVSDGCGNTNTTYTQVIHVVDNTEPVIYCPGNTAIGSEESSDPSNTGSATATDNCTATTDILISHTDASIAGSCNGNNSIVRTWRATDACGNYSTCLQIITVQDIVPPVVTGTISPTTLEACNISGLPPAVTTVAALEALGLAISDNTSADVNLVVTHSDAISGFCPTVLTRTYRVADECGNITPISQIFDITDTTKPSITCPVKNVLVVINNLTDQTYKNSGTGWDAIATDNCPSPVMTAELTGNTTSLPNLTTLNNVTFNIGTTTVIWTATDACGNTSACSFDVVVNSNIADLKITKTGTASATSGTQIEYTITVTNNGPADAQNVLISDVIPVGLTSPQVGTNLSGPWVAWTSPYIVETLANAASVTIYIRGTISINQCGSISNTATVSSTTGDDVPGNNSSTVSTIVLDQTKPVINCPAEPATICANNAGNYTHGNTSWDATATDNCTVSSIFYTLSGSTTGTGSSLNGVVFNSGTTTVVWRASDTSGNFAECTFNVTINPLPLTSNIYHN